MYLKNFKIDYYKDLMLQPVTVKDFLNMVINETPNKFSLAELNFYMMINDSFFPIERVDISTSGAIEVRNETFDLYYEVTTQDENCFIFNMVNKKLVFGEGC